MIINRFTAGTPHIQPPWRMDAAQLETHRWDREVDVVVIGFGGAGASAAIEARHHGADVLVAERFMGGGSTKISGGIFYAGGGTSIQQAAGVEDDADNMFRYLQQEVKDAVSETTLRRFCDHSVDNFNWLCEHGVAFDASYCPIKTSYPSNQYYFYYSGNESFPPYSDHAKPVPRGHRAHAPGVSGAALFNPLKQSAERAGVRIETQYQVNQLVTDNTGHIIGVNGRRMKPGSLSAWLHRQLFALMVLMRYATIFTPFVNHLIRWVIEELEKRAEPFSIRARKGVVLGSGGFYYNREMLKQYAPAYLKGTPLGTIADNGSGIQLGESVGGSTALMDSVSAWRFINPPNAFARGVMLGPDGKRVCNEMLYGAQMGERLVKEHGGKGYLIIDQRLWKLAHKQLGPKQAMWFQSVTALMYLWLERKKAPTLQALAEKLGLPVDAVLQSVAEYNTLAMEKHDPMGKTAEFLEPITEGPFYALNCSFDSMIVPCPSLTLGGLRVDEHTGEVLDKQGNAIRGLYAAGRTAVGIASRSYVSGLSIADCVFSGRRAGAHVANR
ncbi:MAG: FAD-binding protein [Gammaproteobacteria bacterium]|nr:MAG: FAD-binding protein [Gammaproteobacteria bacterium]